MKNKIYEIIKTEKSLSFDKIFEVHKGSLENKGQLNSFLKELTADKKIAKFGNSYLDLEQFETITGYSNYNINGGAWLSQEYEGNSFGVSFGINDKSIVINNKKNGFFGSQVIAKKIILPDVDGKSNTEFAYILESKPSQDFKVIASYNEHQKTWNILNSELPFSFTSPQNLENNVPHGTIAVFDYKSKNNNYSYLEILGNYADHGIESQIVEKLGAITLAPAFQEFTHQTPPILKKLDKPFYTIDSIYTKDVDDAIWIEKKQNGYKLYVAIADASSFILPGTEADLHAQNEGTSFYLPHKTVHMLNNKLAEDYCSLNVGKPRQSMIVEMDIDALGETQSHKFYQANIMVESRLNYDDVDKMLNNEDTENCLVNEHGKVINLKESNPSTQRKILDSLKLLFDLSQVNLSAKNNAFFRGNNLEIKLNEKGKIDYLYEQPISTPSQKMVETAMLKANIAAADNILKEHPEFGMFRNQLTPEKIEQPRPAFYDSANQGHWGLQTPFYTHFTSPIRRYCDLVVHRLLKSINANDQSFPHAKDQLESISLNINQQQYKSKQCELKSKKLLIAQYMEDLIKTNQLDKNWQCIDYSANGLVLRNKQFIEVYTPLFTLSFDFQKKFKQACENQDLLNPEKKIEGVNYLNNEWTIDIVYPDFQWDGDNKDKIVKTFPKIKKILKV